MNLMIVPKVLWTTVFALLMTIPPILLCLISILLYPFIAFWNRRLLTKINITFADYMWWFYIYLLETWGNCTPNFYGEDIPYRENAVVVSNHNTIIDWAFFFSIGGRRGRLGTIKFFAKESVKYWPGFGWGIYLLDAIFLKRNWTEDKSLVEEAFRTLKSRGLPFWAISFLEGTRATKKKLEESQKFCRERGKPILKNILYPRTKGFTATISGLGDSIDAVYVITVMFENCRLPTIIDLACRSMPEIHYHIKRYPIEDMMKIKDLPKWCEDRWVEKDMLIDYFKEHGKFPNPRPEGEWSYPYRHESMHIWGNSKVD